MLSAPDRLQGCVDSTGRTFNSTSVYDYLYWSCKGTNACSVYADKSTFGDDP